MNLNHFEAIQTVQKLHYLVPKEVYEDVEISVHPPFTDLRSVQRDMSDFARRSPAVFFGGAAVLGFVVAVPAWLVVAAI